MILVDNINILKEKYDDTWKYIKQIEEKLNLKLIQIENTKQELKTLVLNKDNKKSYIHSKYNPVREAEVIIDSYEDDIREDTVVLFYGLGLGYHIDIFEKKYRNNKFYIYEPIEEIGCIYLSNEYIGRFKRLKDIIIGANMDKIVNLILDTSNQKIVIIELPSHRKTFNEEYEKFIKAFKVAVDEKIISISTDLNFQKEWIINSMRNFKYVLNTPNILIENKGRFKDKPALIVSSGPSLDQDIESIRYIKENGLAYIFSAGSSINSLINNNIYPDAICTYDPGKLNRKVFDNIINLGIENIPIIFGSSVNFDILQDFKFKKYHTISTQDSVCGYYIDTKDIKLTSDATTIAVITLDILHELGFNPIIFAGQNLGYIDGRLHAKGRHYNRNLTEKEKKEAIFIEDVHGDIIMTTKGYEIMKNELEYYIKIFKDTTILNTTKAGAKIEGAKFLEIEEVIDEILKERVVDERLVESINTGYDINYLYKQHNSMENAFKKVEEILKEYRNVLDEIEKYIKIKNFIRIENLYLKLDKIFSKFENNEFIKTFILPMNRVQYKSLVESIDNINSEKDRIKKGQAIIQCFEHFLSICSKDIKDLKEIYEEMSKNIKEYCRKINTNKLKEGIDYVK